MDGITTSDLVLLVPELILVGAALALMLAARWIRSSHVAVAATVLAALGSAAASVWLFSDEPVTGFGGMLIADGYARFFKLLIAATVGLVALLSVQNTEEEQAQPGEYHALLLLAATGMMLAAAAVDLITLYLALELVTICGYILVGITVDRPTSNEAGIKYFLLGSFASALLLFGISLTFGVTGATGFQEIAAALSGDGLKENPMLLGAVGFLAAGLAFKISAVPFHSWAPDAYQGASAPVAAFLAAGSKAAGLAALGRVCLSAFSAEGRTWSLILMGMAALSIVVGSILMLSQTSMKRLLAYSSIAHAGYALLGLVAGGPEGAAATMTYVFFYVFMTLGTFGLVIALGDRGENLDGYQGLASQRPAAAAVMLLFLMSLTGIPPTAGFVAKFVVILSAVREGYMIIAVLAVICSVVSAFVYMRVAVFMFMKEPEEGAPPRFSAAVSVALALAALVTLLGGVFPGSLADWVVSP